MEHGAQLIKLTEVDRMKQIRGIVAKSRQACKAEGAMCRGIWLRLEVIARLRELLGWRGISVEVSDSLEKEFGLSSTGTASSRPPISEGLWL